MEKSKMSSDQTANFYAESDKRLMETLDVDPTVIDDITNLIVAEDTNLAVTEYQYEVCLKCEAIWPVGMTCACERQTNERTTTDLSVVGPRVLYWRVREIQDHGWLRILTTCQSEQEAVGIQQICEYQHGIPTEIIEIPGV